MNTLYLTFANQSVDPLPTLQEEEDLVKRLLSPREKEGHILLHTDSFISVDKIASSLTLYRDQLVLFLYSGHATRNALILREGIADSSGIAHMLGQCPNLKLVFLNGCSTSGQAQKLLENGVPLVLGTSAPVNDRSATRFSVRFFEALQQQFSIREAFELAKGALVATTPDISIELHRGIGFGKAEQAEWGLYVHPEKEHLLDWKLPARKPQAHTQSDWVPNQLLIERLMDGLRDYNAEVLLYAEQERMGKKVSLSKKRLAILNALPAPLAEPLRKLMVPVDEENEGYDKISLARLRQLGLAYYTAMELLAFTMLAQLWESYYDLGNLKLTIEQRERIYRFLQLPREERLAIDLIPLIRTVREIFDAHQIRYFVQELRELRAQLLNDTELSNAIAFLQSMVKQTQNQQTEPEDIAYLCERAEASLASLFLGIGFMARYRLATIQGIDVEKYRHQQNPQYRHETVMLHDLLGGFDHSSVRLEKSMDNRSILLINEENWAYLNLSPFVIDENAFRDRAEICKLYFYSHYLPSSKCYFFKYVNKPDDPLLEVDKTRHPLVYDQLEAFFEQVLQQPL